MSLKILLDMNLSPDWVAGRLSLNRSPAEGCSMSPTLKKLGIDQLTVAERILLVEEIWDSIATEDLDIPLTDAQRQDLQRRVADHEANPKAGSGWEDVRARLRHSS